MITSISKVQTNLSHLRGLLEHLCCKHANRKPANFDDFDHVITFDDHFDRNYHMREQKYGSQEKICLVLDILILIFSTTYSTNFFIIIIIIILDFLERP